MRKACVILKRPGISSSDGTGLNNGHLIWSMWMKLDLPQRPIALTVEHPKEKASLAIALLLKGPEQAY